MSRGRPADAISNIAGAAVELGLIATITTREPESSSEAKADAPSAEALPKNRSPKLLPRPS